MNRAVIYYKDTDNIGDDIQTLAASQLIGNVDTYLDREQMHTYNGPEVNALCNGYFMWDPTHWPPSDKIDPLFISFHISSLNQCQEIMARPELAAYYNSKGPIGCRDHKTKDILQAIGVDAYYSSCLTQTLEKKKGLKSSGEILFVDAFLKMNNQDYEDYFIDKMVPPSLKSKVDVVRHSKKIKHLPISERLALAEQHVDRYAAADLVITSRIHCALPCLAYGTPVYFMDLGYDRKGARARFKGILDMMNIVSQSSIPFSSNRPHIKVLRKLNAYKLFKGTSDKAIDWDHAENKSPLPQSHKEKISRIVHEKFPR